MILHKQASEISEACFLFSYGKMADLLYNKKKRNVEVSLWNS